MHQYIVCIELLHFCVHANIKWATTCVENSRYSGVNANLELSMTLMQCFGEAPKDQRAKWWSGPAGSCLWVLHKQEQQKG